MSRKERVKLSYDAAFQEKILRVMYLDADFTVQFCVSSLEPSLFENNVHAWFAKEILNYAKKYASGITREALRIAARHAFTSGRLVRKRDRPVVLALLSKLRKPVKDRSYIKNELYSFVKTQTLKDVIEHGLVPLIKSNDVAKYDGEIQRILDIQPPTEGGFGHFMTQHRSERYKRRIDWVPEGIATGLEVDTYIKHGGPRKRQLAAVVAPPHTGKTSCLVHLAKQAVLLANKKVLFISLEEDDLTIQDRFDAAFTGVNINDLEKPGNSKKIRRYWKRFARAHTSEVLVVKEFPMVITTVSQIERYIKSLERKGFYPDVVFLDYAGLVKPETGNSDSRNSSRYEDIGTVYVELRSLAQRLNVLVWTAHQGNRESMGKKIVTMKDLAESFKPAMHADLLLAICQTEAEKEREKARIYTMKVRGGRANMEFSVKVDYEHVRVINRSAS